VHRLGDGLDEPGLQKEVEVFGFVVMVGRKVSVAIDRAKMVEGIRVW
jgi:hypothetical protein